MNDLCSGFSTDLRNRCGNTQVQLLWAALRKNNFDLHILKSKAEDNEKSLEEVTSRVEKVCVFSMLSFSLYMNWYCVLHILVIMVTNTMYGIGI